MARSLEGINSGQPGLFSPPSCAAGQPVGPGQAAGTQGTQQPRASATPVQTNAQRGRSTERLSLIHI
eukprot:10038646-Alexandrium_andersonii.AAC.1